MRGGGIASINHEKYNKTSFKKIKKKKPELIFLDFSESVFEKFNIFKDSSYKPYVVFILNDKKSCYEILKYERLNYFAADCILRPLNKKKVKKVLERFYDYYRK